MVLRVTQNMMHSQLLNNLNNNMSRMEKNQNILATGKKISTPSDDPVGVTYALRYRSEISINDQYQKNIDAAKSAVDHTDTVLGQINNVIQRAKELTVQGLNGTNPQSALNAISQEMGSLYDQAVTSGNDQFNGKFIFNGQMTDKTPYTNAGAPTESTDNGNIIYQFAAGVTIPVNATGNQVFGSPTDSDNLFTVLKGLQNAFASGNQTTAKSLLDQLTTRMDKFLVVRAGLGATANRIDLMDARTKDLALNLNTLDAKTEDADIAATMTNLQTDQNVYQASLSVGAKIVQPSLLDYLK